MSIPFKSKWVQVEVSMLIFDRADLKKIRTLKMETIKARDMRKAWVSLSHSYKSYLEFQPGRNRLQMSLHGFTQKASRIEQPDDKAWSPGTAVLSGQVSSEDFHRGIPNKCNGCCVSPDPSYYHCSFFYRPVSREVMAENWQGQIWKTGLRQNLSLCKKVLTQRWQCEEAECVRKSKLRPVCHQIDQNPKKWVKLCTPPCFS